MNSRFEIVQTPKTRLFNSSHVSGARVAEVAVCAQAELTTALGLLLCAVVMMVGRAFYLRARVRALKKDI